MNKETKVILNEIKKLATNNELMVQISVDEETFRKSYGFFLSFEETDGFEQVEATFNINTLNEVLKNVLNEGFAVSFDAIFA